jgi:hypothetical protein
MERAMSSAAEGIPAPARRLRFLGSLIFLGLLAWQGWMTARLFGPGPAWQRLLDDEPIVSGRHPLHLYQSYLGARCLRERGTDCCYDPAFQAGYPKTPVFDSGSRPAELFLMVAGGASRPAAYKMGFAACCLAVPFVLLLSARGAGLAGFASLLATALGQLVWWGGPCRQLLEAGDLDLLLAGLASLAAVGSLLVYDRSPGPVGWLGLFASGAFGLFAQPIWFAGFFPLVLVYYLSVGARHRLAWHVALVVALAGGVLVNFFWLGDWFAYWWVRLPLSGEAALLPHRTFHTLWAAAFWGERPDRALAGALGVAAAVGIVVLNQRRQRAGARLLGLGVGGFLLLAVAGVSWEPLGRLSTSRLLVPALLFAALPAGHACALALRGADQLLRGPGRGALALGLVLASLWLAGEPAIRGLAANCAGASPLAIGLTPREEEVIWNIRERTTPEARILWEELPSDNVSFWTPLLPVLAPRFYLGGLDPDGCIEHGYASLVDQKLAGRPLESWTDAEMQDFCRRYNVGWTVCRSPQSIARFHQWPAAEWIAGSTGDSPWSLFRLPGGSFAIEGQARLIEADCQHIALVDLIPEDGKVVLSLHYQAGMRVSPSRVQIEKEADVSDPIPFVRLRMQGPVARVTLTWQQR